MRSISRKSAGLALHVVVDEFRLAHFEVGEIAGLALAGRLGDDGSFGRRCGVRGRGGFGVFRGVGIEQQFELGGIKRLALAAEELAEDLVKTLAQQLVFEAQPPVLRPQEGGVVGVGVVRWRHLLRT